MRGYELRNLLHEEFGKKGTGGGPVRFIDDQGQTYDVAEVTTEMPETTDGTAITWVKLEPSDGDN